MPDEYGCWSKNPFVSSNNGTSDWRIFKKFPNNVNVWYYVVADVGQEKLFLFLRTITQIEVVFNNHPKFFNTFS